MLVKEEQSLKAASPIEVTPLGISMLVKPEHSLKASHPIEASCELSPKLTLVKEEQP